MCAFLSPFEFLENSSVFCCVDRAQSLKTEVESGRNFQKMELF